MKVEATGELSKATSLITQLFDSFQKMMDNAAPNSLKLQDESAIKIKELDDTLNVPGKQYVYKALKSKRLVTVDVFLISGDKFNVHVFIKCPGLPTGEIKKIARDKVVQEVRRYCVEHDLLDVDEEDEDITDDEHQGEYFDDKDQGVEDEETAEYQPLDTSDLGEFDIEECKKINVKLRKINASSELDLVAINCNYSIHDAIADLAVIADDIEFVDSLTEEPQAFEIIPDAADISVQEVSDFDPSARCYTEMYTESLALYNNIKSIHWGSKGEGFFTLHEKAEEIANEIHDRLDVIAEWEVQHNKKIINANKLNVIEYLIETDYGFDRMNGFSAIRLLIQKDIEALEAFYTNLPHDEQSIVDDWVAYDNKLANYLLTRIEEI